MHKSFNQRQYFKAKNIFIVVIHELIIHVFSCFVAICEALYILFKSTVNANPNVIAEDDSFGLVYLTEGIRIT